MSELELLKSGDKELIESIYDECFAGISSWIRSNSGTENDAEDVFQDSMVVLYKKALNSNFNLSCKLSTFIFSIARNIWLDRLRKKSRSVYLNELTRLEISEIDHSALNEIMLDMEVDLVYKRNFQKLIKECQEILTLYFNGNSMEEIVDIMGFSNPNIARKRKFRCKNKLVVLVENDPHYSELISKT